MGYRSVGWICGVVASIAFGANVVMAQSPEIRALGPLGSEKAGRAPCRATGDACFLGIDPDIASVRLTAMPRCWGATSESLSA